MTANAAQRLLQHYVDNFRDLPWRAPPGHPPPEPYRVWLSEVMLQQTTVAAVVPRFERFVAKWPTVEALAAASDEDILSEWAGLGYYARARNLIACAREVVKIGGFPATAKELSRLPGIGRYTSAAVAAIAFEEPLVAVDTNVVRVIARFHGIKQPQADHVEHLAARLRPPDRAGDFTQALMDLGATVCRIRKPRCEVCPMSEDCNALASGQPEAYPERGRPRVRPLRQGTAWWIERDGSVWLTRRPAKGLLGAMAALPGSDWAESARQPPEGRLGTVRHVFTHFALDLHIVRRDRPVGEGWWQSLDGIDSAGLPTLYRKAVALAAGSSREREPEVRSAA